MKSYSLSLIQIILVLISAMDIDAANITTAKQGNWSDGSTWQGGVVPGADDVVTVVNTLYVDCDAKAASISVSKKSSVDYSGSIIVNEGASLSVVGEINFTLSTCKLTNYGTITSSSLKVNSKQIVIDGPVNSQEIRFKNSDAKFTANAEIRAETLTLASEMTTTAPLRVTTMNVDGKGRLYLKKPMEATTVNITAGGMVSGVSDECVSDVERLNVANGAFHNNRGILNVSGQAIVGVEGLLDGAGICNLLSTSHAEGEESLRNFGIARTNLMIYGDIYNEGSMSTKLSSSSYADHAVTFCGTSKQVVTTTSDLEWYKVVVDNTSSPEYGVHVVGGDVKIVGKLTLTRGVLHIEDGHSLLVGEQATSSSKETLVANKKDSYVDGLLIRPVRSNTVLFPLGNNGRSGYAMISGHEDGSSLELRNIGVRYVNAKPMHGDETLLTYALLQDEYWQVTNEDDAEGFGDIRFVNLRADEGSEYNETTVNGVKYGMYVYIPQKTDNAAEATLPERRWYELQTAQVNTNTSDINVTAIPSDVTVVASSPRTIINPPVKFYPGKSGQRPYYFTFGHKQVVVSAVEQTISSGTLVDGDPQYTWTGIGLDNRWASADNWLMQSVPDADADVYLANTYSYGDITFDFDGKSYTRKVSAKVMDGNYPIVRDMTVVKNHSADNVNEEMIAEGIATAKSVTIHGAEPVIELSGGALDVKTSIEVEDKASGHIVVNNRYDKSSALKFGSMNYDGVVVNRTFMSGILNYTGSSTKEATFTTTSEVGRLSVFNPSTGEFSSALPQKRFGENWLGGTLALSGNGEDATITQTGTLYQGNGRINLYAGEDKWNVIVNPYMYAVDMSQSGAISFSNAQETIWFRRYNIASDQYYFTTYNAAAHISVAEGASRMVNASQNSLLAPQQSFYVMSTSSESPYIQFDNDNQITRYGSLSQLKGKNGVNENDVLRLVIETTQGIADEMAMVFREGGSLSVTNYDSYKYPNASGEYNQIYAIKNGISMSIPYYPSVVSVANETFRIGMRLANDVVNGKIVMANADEFCGEVFLTDNERKQTVNLSSTREYAFQKDVMSLDNRFTITLKAKPMATDIDTETIEGDGFIRIYDIVGRLVSEREIHDIGSVSRQSIKEMAGQLHGIYIVEVVSSNGRREIMKVAF